MTAREVAVEYVCGALAGSANIIVGYPFDTVKVRLQAKSCPYTGPWQCFTSIIRLEGTRGVFRGLSAPLVGGALETGVNYAIFQRTLHSLHGKYPEKVVVPLSAAMAGVGLSVIVSPAELVKCRMQLGASDSRHSYKGPLDCLQQLVRTEGYKGLFRGLGATMAREVPGNAIFFASYRSIREVLKGSNKELDFDMDAKEQAVSIRSILTSISSAIAAGAMSGIIMWSVVLPLDACKTRIQTAWPGSVHDAGIRYHLLQMWQEGRWRRLYAGLTPTLIRAAPANAAQWLMWELCMGASTSWRKIPSVEESEKWKSREGI